MANKYDRIKTGVGKPCEYCRRRMVKPDSDEAYEDPGLVASVEHKYPRSKGGTNELYNLTHACKRCNGLRSDIALQLFGPFARVVLQRYPNAPAPVLREALKKFIYHCAELSLKNEKGIKSATLATLIDLDKQIIQRGMDAQSSKRT